MMACQVARQHGRQHRCALSPIVCGLLVLLGSWQAPFIVAAALLVAGSAVWAFWRDPDKPILVG